MTNYLIQTNQKYKQTLLEFLIYKLRVRNFTENDKDSSFILEFSFSDEPTPLEDKIKNSRLLKGIPLSFEKKA